jgi:hypothetical protein
MALSKPLVLHCMIGFTSPPWVEGNKHPFNEEWQKYKKLSLWRDIAQIKMNVAPTRVLYKLLPKKLFLIINKQKNKMMIKRYYRNI